MPDEMILIDAQGFEKLHAKLVKLPPALQDDVAQAGNEEGVRILGQYDVQYHYVSRKQAYGKTFVSEAQRKFVMAKIREGEIKIPYSRTGGLRKGWRVVGEGRNSFIANDTPGAGYVMGDIQSRHEALVGWKKGLDVLNRNIAKLIKGATKGVAKAIRKVGLIPS